MKIFKPFHKAKGERYTEAEKTKILNAARAVSRKHGELTAFLKMCGLSYPTFRLWTGKAAKELPRWRWRKNAKHRRMNGNASFA